VAAAPSGWRIRTVAHSGGHRVRVAFPPGRRRKGSGKLVSILHPKGERNPCEVNPAELIIVGANPAELIVAGANPKIRVSFDPAVKKFVAATYHEDFGNLFMTGDTSAEARAALKRRIKQAEAAGTARNPNGAAELYQEFHGAPARRETEYHEPAPRPQTLTELGDMLLLTVLRVRGYKWGEVDFGGCGVKLASNAKGTQISLVGGDQSLSRGTLTDLGADNSKELVDLGEALVIVYRTKKSLAGGVSANYEHNFGEETGRRPTVMYDQRTKRISFVGGEYTVAAPGIIN
jgi:hypothetical protein